MQSSGPRQLEFRASSYFAAPGLLLHSDNRPVSLRKLAGLNSVQGSGIEPQLGFACCDQGVSQMQALFADPATVTALRNLHAEVAVALSRLLSGTREDSAHP